MPIITAAQLAIVAPRADPKIAAAIVEHADDVLVRYGLATRARLADFMAQVLVESAYLTTAAEDLNYSAPRLVAVWPSRFPTEAAAAPFAHAPEALACKVYGGRMGNDTARDGWTYRGQGLLQITGKDTYGRLAAKLGKSLDETVLLITSAEGMLECAAATYVMLGAPPHADAGDIVATTRCINGGENGLADRRAMLAKCLKVWPAVAGASTAVVHVDADKPVLASIETAINAAAAAQAKPGPLAMPYTPPALVQHSPVAAAAPKPGFWRGLAAALTPKKA